VLAFVSARFRHARLRQCSLAFVSARVVPGRQSRPGRARVESAVSTGSTLPGIRLSRRT
jgi:hypothetical protein